MTSRMYKAAGGIGLLASLFVGVHFMSAAIVDHNAQVFVGEVALCGGLSQAEAQSLSARAVSDPADHSVRTPATLPNAEIIVLDKRNLCHVEGQEAFRLDDPRKVQYFADVGGRQVIGIAAPDNALRFAISL